MQVWDELKRPGHLRSLVAMLAGTVFALGWMLTAQSLLGFSVMGKGQMPPNGPLLYRIMLDLHELLVLVNSWPWILLLLALFAWKAIRQRDKKEGWIAAMLTGVALISALAQLVQKIWG